MNEYEKVVHADKIRKACTGDVAVEVKPQAFTSPVTFKLLTGRSVSRILIALNNRKD